MLDADFTLGETGASGGAFERFDLVLPPGMHRIQFTAPGYRPSEVSVSVEPGSAVTREIGMIRDAADAGAPAADPRH